MEWIVLIGAVCAALWIGNVSGDTDRVVREKVEEATGSEKMGEVAGNGCGWLIFFVLFLIFVVAFPVALVATMPEDCQTIVVNRAMGRCP